jgi:hypothetical protein
MEIIRPQARRFLTRWREVLVALCICAFGLWVARLGGYVLVPIGALIVTAGLSLAILALRRARFRASGEAPGLVQVDEGQVGYLGPTVGGFVSLPDLVELRLISMRGRRLWRLKQADGQTILIPVEAEGAERLFDAFSSLPGMSSAALIAALQPVGGAESRAVQAGGENRMVWRRQGKGVVAHAPDP